MAALTVSVTWVIEWFLFFSTSVRQHTFNTSSGPHGKLLFNQTLQIMQTFGNLNGTAHLQHHPYFAVPIPSCTVTSGSSDTIRQDDKISPGLLVSRGVVHSWPISRINQHFISCANTICGDQLQRNFIRHPIWWGPLESVQSNGSVMRYLIPFPHSICKSVQRNDRWFEGRWTKQT